MTIFGGGGSFEPSSVTIGAGTKVTWTNVGYSRARVRDLNHNFLDSGDLQPGQSYSFMFCTPGSFQIADHRGSGWATIIVAKGPTPSPTPSPSPGGSPAPNSLVRMTSVDRTPGGKVILTAVGIPSYVHSAQGKVGISGDYITIGFVNSDAQGLLYFEDPNPDKSGFTFYRFTAP